MLKNSKKKAQSLIEYGLILALVAIIAITVLSKLGSGITKVGTNVSNQLDTASSHAMDSYCTGIGQGTFDVTTGQCTGAGDPPD